MFVHNPINGVYGNADEMREMADILDKIGTSLTATYAKRWTGEEKALADALAAETYFSASECLEYGLCDEVTPAITAEAAFDVDNLPEQLKAVFKSADPREPDPPAAAPTADEVEAACKVFKLEAYAGTLALEALPSVEALDVRVAEVREIHALCRLTGQADKAKALVLARTPLVEARAHLKALDAANDQHVDTAPKPKPSGAANDELNPYAFWRTHAQTKTWSKK
jgi:hypothetical protein